MDHAPLYIADSAALSRLVAEVGPGPLALDTEADSMHHYREKVCLVQLSFAGRDVIVDPLAGVDLHSLGPVLLDAGVRKVLHGADYDLRILGRDHGLSVRGVFDTMIAARLVGETAFSLSALLSTYLGVTLYKGHQRADWSRRPLPSAMIAYAAADTRHLAALCELLEKRLADLGRTAWAEEEFARLSQVRWQRVEDPESFRRVKEAGALDRRSLGILREVHALREQKARERDVPPFRILMEETMVAMVRARPRTPADLLAIRGLPKPQSLGPALNDWLAAVQRGLDLPEERLPEFQKAARPPRDPPFEAKMAKARTRRDALAARLSLDPSLIVSKAVLEAALRTQERGEPLDTVPDLRRWQAGLVEEILAG
jgi:ribonuclease D